LAVTHRTVEEFWFILAGRGQVWRKQGEREEVTKVEPGMALTIPLGTHFQFRSERDAPLDFVIVTMPPWPGDHEAVRVRDHWAIEEA
jgi:mannose-6-phosphate isomerase-like protein (cupin superfamily)